MERAKKFYSYWLVLALIFGLTAFLGAKGTASFSDAGVYGNDCPPSVPDSLCIGASIGDVKNYPSSGGGRPGGLLVSYRTPIL